jgi:transposase
MLAELERMEREQLLVVAKEQYENNEILRAENESLQFQMDKLRKMIFGIKNERFVSEVAEEQTSLDFGAAPEVPKAPPVTETVTYERKKNNGKKPSRQALPSHLPRIVHVIRPEEDVTGWISIGKEITEELEYVPGKLYINVYERLKYLRPAEKKTDVVADKSAEVTEEKEAKEVKPKVVIGKLPERPLPKCIAGPQLLSAIIVAKFIDHLPAYRQEQMFKRQGIDIADATMCGWVNAVGRLLKALYEAHKKKLLLSIYLMADETPVPVLESDKPGSTHKGYHWAYYDPVNKQVLFDYRPGRGKEGPAQILKNFKGHLQTDGYAVYDEYGRKVGITLMHCWAHARRKFVDALDNDRTRAEYVLTEIQKLYAVEREIKETNASPAEALAMRQERAVPVIKGLKQWMITNKPEVMPKSPIGKAIDYTLSRIDALKVYTTDAKLQIDNNPVENSIRPIALGRKNYLFAGSHQAAENAAIFYSLFATCKVKGINPHTWLAETLEKIATHPISRIEELLPGWTPEPAGSEKTEPGA